MKMDDIIMVKMRTTNKPSGNAIYSLSRPLPGKRTLPLFTLPEDTKPGRVNHMAKFKAFHEFQKPLIGFTPESFPHLHEDKFRLCRNGNSQRPLMQGSQRGRGSIFLDTEGIEAKYSFLGQRTYHRSYC